MYDPFPILADHDGYATPPDRRRRLLARLWPTGRNSFDVLWLVLSNYMVLRRTGYPGPQWVRGSQECHRFLERNGGNIHVTGMRHLREVDGPAILVGNHMSTLETFFLPAVIHPVLPFCFVVKPSLMRLPLFGKITQARKAIAVTRDNPRQDLKIVLEEGARRLEAGMSVAIFPQHTRSVEFEPKEFNSLGAKLARRTGAKVIPLALQTDAWGIGRWVKDLGPFRPSRPIRFAFGAPIDAAGREREAHAECSEWITTHLERWREQDASGDPWDREVNDEADTVRVAPWEREIPEGGVIVRDVDV